MKPSLYIKRLVVLAFVIEVTSRPSPYGSRIINFLGSSIGAASSVIDCDKQCDNGRRHHNQKNIRRTGSDSSLVEISFQPLRELETVSSLTSLYPLARTPKFFQEYPIPQSSSSSVVTATPTATPSYLSNKAHTPTTSQRYFSNNNRQRRRTSHRHQLLKEDDDFQTYHQRYPDEASSIEGPTTAFTPAVGLEALNRIPYPAEDPFGFMHRDLQYSIQNDIDLLQEESENSMGNFPWDVFKRQPHPATKDPMTMEETSSRFMDSDANNKRNALATFKRQKFKSHQTQFVPSISGGAMTNLGDFFRNLKNNIEFMEKSRLSNSEEVLLEGDHPMKVLREELNSDGTKPTGTAAFLHAIRNYRPSQRIRSLVALNPEGYHGSQFLDPNYMWLGLGKR